MASPLPNLLVLGIGILTLSALSCERSEPKRTIQGRSQSIIAAESTDNGSAQPTATGLPSVGAPAPRPPLCQGQMARPARPFEPPKASRAAAPGGEELPERMALKGGWTWINFWAAWCGPCKEEMPRLLDWEKKLSETRPFRLLFVSLDDDERQLFGFLEQQPETGVRRTYWLKPGQERTAWLSSANLTADPELPMHLLVDHEGRIRCTIRGVVEDNDLKAVSAITHKQ